MDWIGPFSFVSALANFVYPAIYLCLLIVSLLYLRRYPKPALYFAIANGLFLSQILLRPVAIPIAQRVLLPDQVSWAFSLLSLVAIVINLGAMLMTAAAVFCSRQVTTNNLHRSADGSHETLATQSVAASEKSDDFLSDDPSPYRPPRLPR